MPNYSCVISKAVDLVAQTLAGMDSETIAHFTRILSEEAKTICEDLLYSGQHVKLDILAARLDGLVKRMKYEFFYKGPDLSPYEVPIFNVSHNSTTVYPYPINHLYDKHYQEAYSTLVIKQQESERVIMIDRHDSNSSMSGKYRLRTSKIGISATSAVLTTPSTGYNIKIPRSYIPMSNNIYSPNGNGYYPFVYYRY